MKMLTVLMLATLSMSAYASSDQMGDSTIFATTYIVRGDSVFVKSNPSIVLGEIKYKGYVYIYRKNVEIASFNSSVTPDSLRNMDSIYVDSVAPNCGIFKNSKGKVLGTSIMHVKSYSVPVSIVHVPSSFSPKKNFADFRSFNLKGQHRTTASGITIINRRAVVTFGITKQQ